MFAIESTMHHLDTAVVVRGAAYQGRRSHSRMREKTASGVLASLRRSTYGPEYASPLRSLRPCWTAFLRILHSCSASSHSSISVTAPEVNMFSAA